MDNKSRFQEWAIFAALIIWVGLTIITCAGLWNAATKVKVEGFYITVSIITAVVNVAIAVVVWIKVWNKSGKPSIEESKKK